MKMVFYSLLLVASVTIALVVLYLYNQFSGVGKAVYRALLPSAKNNSTRKINQPNVRVTVNHTPTPWGWQGKTAQADRVRQHSASPPRNVPWGWKGNHHEIREHSPKRTVQNATQETARKTTMGLDAFLNKHENGSESDSVSRDHVGWPYREEKLEFARKSYKVKRKATPARRKLKTASKPWGW
jgi:hypothetical protein